jgi:type VI secretion system secreted protein Hcp
MSKATGTSGQQQVFLKYDFTDVMVESIQWSGSSGGDDTPTESVSFAFGKVAITYSKQDDASGAMSPAGNASWDLTKVSK